MCANCRSGRGGFVAFDWYFGSWPHPWVWLRIWKLDLCFMPKDRWRWEWPSRYSKKMNMPLEFTYGYFGPLEIGWLQWK